MSEATDKIEKWFKDASEYNLSTWDRLPEIYLYMDQVLTYMNKQLTPYEGSRTSGQLTSSMINNYVKDGVLERPKQKKICSRASCCFNCYLHVKICSFYSGNFYHAKYYGRNTRERSSL